MLNLVIVAALAAAPVPQKAASKPPASPDKLICRRIEETGSLVRAVRVCHTRSEWNALTDAGRQQADAFLATSGASGSPPK